MGKECKYHTLFMITSRYWYFGKGIKRLHGLFWNKFNVSDCRIILFWTNASVNSTCAQPNPKSKFYSSFVWFVRRKILACADPSVWVLLAFLWLHTSHLYSLQRNSSYLLVWVLVCTDTFQRRRVCSSAQMHGRIWPDALDSYWFT